jgi:hypothetical protein
MHYVLLTLGPSGGIYDLRPGFGVLTIPRPSPSGHDGHPTPYNRITEGKIAARQESLLEPHQTGSHSEYSSASSPGLVGGMASYPAL